MGKCLAKPHIEERFSSVQPNILNNPQAMEELQQLKLISKTEIDSISKQLIFHALSHNHLFREITAEDLESLYRFFIFGVANEKQLVFQQDSIGTLFYVINSGTVEVIVDDKVKGQLSKAACFGEMALLSDSKRKASIRAKVKSSFWILSQYDFVLALKKLYAKKFDLVRKVISKAAFFRNFPDSLKDSLSRLALFHSYQNGEFIINEGDQGNLLFILLAGCVVLKKSSKEFLRLTRVGDMFGEGAILTGKKRMATCVASGFAHIISINQSSLEKVFGPDFRVILKKNIAKNSILSDPHMAFLRKSDSIKISDSLTWKDYKNGQLVISSSYIKRSCFRVICIGGIASNEKIQHKIGAYEIIGLGNINEKSLKNKKYFAVGPTFIGEISTQSVEKLLHININDLYESLKRIKFLKSVSIFSMLSLDSLKLCAENSETRRSKAGEVVFKAGYYDEIIFIVKTGSFKIFKDKVTIRIIGKNQIFGERCLKEKTRTASAKCIEDSKYLAIRRSVIFSLPEINEIMAEVERKWYYQMEINLSLTYIRYEIEGTQERRKYCIKVKNSKLLYELAVIPKCNLQSQAECMSLVEEKNLMLKLDHRLTLKLVRSKFDQKNIYFITEHIRGSPLCLLKSVSEDYLKVLVVYLTSIIENLHDKNIIYRNFCPDNIIISEEGLPYLRNFETAKLTAERAYTRIGNPYYRPPEMILGRGYSKSTDYWSLGVTLFELAYGHLPFGISNNEPPVNAYEKILSGKVGTSTIQPHGFNDIINKLLSPADFRINLEAIRNSIWLYSVQWEKIINSNRLSIEYPKLKSAEIRTFKKHKPVLEFLEKYTVSDLHPDLKGFDWEKYF